MVLRRESGFDIVVACSFARFSGNVVEGCGEGGGVSQRMKGDVSHC